MFCYCKKLSKLPDISKWNLNSAIDIYGLFSFCKSLKTLPDISKWRIKSTFRLDFLFCGCESLEKLPDISKWNINKSTCINGIFAECYSLKSLPDISKWFSDTDSFNYSSQRIKFHILHDHQQSELKDGLNFSFIFYNCSSLESLPDISNWNTKKVINMHGMFEGVHL